MLPLPRLVSRTALDDLLTRQTAKADLPALFFAATNARETLYLNQAGLRVYGDESKGDVNEDTPVEMFSQTKLVTSVAALQLVDRGVLALDDANVVDKYLHELKDVPFLQGYDENEEAILVKPKNRITLRMLLSHRAGFVYPGALSSLTPWVRKHGNIRLFTARGGMELLTTPLIYEPGTSWRYSHSVDWAGVLISRASGLSLEEYFQKHIFQPLGITSMTFYPTPEIIEKKMWVCQRNAKGLSTLPTGFANKRPECVEDMGLLLGGAGLFGSQKDFLSFLRAVLACDPRNPDPPTQRLLSGEMYTELFTPSVPDEGDALEQLANNVNKWIPVPPLATTDTINHSVGMALALQDMPGRRRSGTGYWGGAAKTNFWIDPASGIAGIVGTSLMGDGARPFEDFAAEFEETLYASLDQTS